MTKPHAHGKVVRIMDTEANRKARTMTTEDKLYEVTKDEYAIFTPQWAMSFTYQGQETEVAWCHVTSVKKEEHDYEDSVIRIRIDGEEVDPYKHVGAYEVAIALRVPEVRQELLKEVFPNLRETGFYEEESLVQAIRILYRRASAGDFVGQFNGRFVYVQTVAEVLDCSIGEVLNILDKTLIANRELSLNGMILWAPITEEEEEESRQRKEDQFGHKDFSMSDFGWWGCRHCGKDGDEYDNPKDFACETKQETDKPTQEAV